MLDADILIKIEQYDTIKKLMLSLGYSCGLESDHELKWHSDNLYLELHRQIVTPKNKDYFSYWEHPWDMAERTEKNHRHKLSDENTFVYLMTHLAAHYRSSGIGVKHVTDIWVYLRSKPDLDKRYIEKELAKLNLARFYRCLISMIGVWFEGGEPDKVTEHMTEYIFTGGAFGTFERNALSNAVKNKMETGAAKNARARGIFTLIFLPYNAIRYKYPVLRKLPVLLPFMWIVRGFEVALYRRANLRKLKNADRRKNRRIPAIAVHGWTWL